MQATWLGYFGTTGLDAMDYIIADRFVLPEGDEKFYSEAPWRLPDSYLCFTPPETAVAVATPSTKGGRPSSASPRDWPRPSASPSAWLRD